jgi:hypothetical protein
MEEQGSVDHATLLDAITRHVGYLDDAERFSESLRAALEPAGGSDAVGALALLVRGGQAWCAYAGRPGACLLMRGGACFEMLGTPSGNSREHGGGWPHPLVLQRGDRLVLANRSAADIVGHEGLCALAESPDPEQACRDALAQATPSPPRGEPGIVLIVMH